VFLVFAGKKLKSGRSAAGAAFLNTDARPRVQQEKSKSFLSPDQLLLGQVLEEKERCAKLQKFLQRTILRLRVSLVCDDFLPAPVVFLIYGWIGRWLVFRLHERITQHKVTRNTITRHKIAPSQNLAVTISRRTQNLASQNLAATESRMNQNHAVTKSRD
jgi:hypothetical protein